MSLTCIHTMKYQTLNVFKIPELSHSVFIPQAAADS